MAEIKVADVSRWQGSIDWDTFSKNVDAVVIKATGYDGGGYADSMLARNRDEARRVGIPRWFYHYKGAGSATEQAKYMLSQIGNLQPGEAIVIDDENEGKVNVAFCAEFADTIKQVAGINTPVYSNQSRFSGLDLSPLKQRNLGAWSAKYGTNSGNPEGSPATAGDMTVIMWQYTSNARVPGVSANTVDMNIFYGDKDAFNKYGVAGAVQVPSVVVGVVPATPAPSTSGQYVVASGDTLSGIGQKLGMDWRTIAATNGIVAPYTIFPGQKLKVFGGTPGQAQVTAAVAGGQYVVVSGDTLSGIGVKTGHSWTDLANLNNIKAPYTIFPGQRIQLPGNAVATPQEATYTVVSGDTLSGIGAKTGRNWRDIASRNNIPAPFTIYPNQVLRLP